MVLSGVECLLLDESKVDEADKNVKLRSVNNEIITVVPVTTEHIAITKKRLTGTVGTSVSSG
jgi:hypothetical protein